jgi:Tol biopolymer transport system component
MRLHSLLIIATEVLLLASCAAPAVTPTATAIIAPTPTSGVDPCLTTAKTYKPGTLPAAMITFECYTDPYGNIDTFSFDTTTGQITNFVDSMHLAEDIQWSPDGTRVAFSSADDGNLTIYVMKTDENKPTKLTEGGTPRWSPNGQLIAFTGKDGIYVTNVDTRQTTHVTKKVATLDGLTWSPDGRRFAFSALDNGHTEVFVVNTDGSQAVAMTSNASEDLFPAWSPDGKHIAFLSDRDGNAEIYSLTEDGAKQTRLTNSPEEEGSLVWAADGQHIAYTKTIEKFPAYGSSEARLYIMNEDGTEKRQIADLPAAYPVWSPDSRYLAFIYDQLYVVKIDDGEMFQLTDGLATKAFPTWVP